MQGFEAPVEGGWHTKKRNLLQSDITKRPAPRPPSHVKTQANTPGYRRIRKLCDSLEESCTNSKADAAALEEAKGSFCTLMKNHVAIAAKSMLDNMLKAKKLVVLVSEQVKRARTLATNFENATELNRLLDCFPSNETERDYRAYYARVSAIEAEVAMEESIRRAEEDKRMMAKGITRVEWLESDDEFWSSVVNRST